VQILPDHEHSYKLQIVNTSALSSNVLYIAEQKKIGWEKEEEGYMTDFEKIGDL